MMINLMLLTYIIMILLKLFLSSTQRNYYASTTKSFDLDYPFGDFLEDTKFNELTKYLQSHPQKKNTLNAISDGENS